MNNNTNNINNFIDEYNAPGFDIAATPWGINATHLPTDAVNNYCNMISAEQDITMFETCENIIHTCNNSCQGLLPAVAISNTNVTSPGFELLRQPQQITTYDNGPIINYQTREKHSALEEKFVIITNEVETQTLFIYTYYTNPNPSKLTDRCLQQLVAIDTDDNIPGTTLYTPIITGSTVCAGVVYDGHDQILILGTDHTSVNLYSTDLMWTQAVLIATLPELTEYCDINVFGTKVFVRQSPQGPVYCIDTITGNIALLPLEPEDILVIFTPTTVSVALNTFIITITTGIVMFDVTDIQNITRTVITPNYWPTSISIPKSSMTTLYASAMISIYDTHSSLYTLYCIIFADLNNIFSILSTAGPPTTFEQVDTCVPMVMNSKLMAFTVQYHHTFSLYTFDENSNGYSEQQQLNISINIPPQVMVASPDGTLIFYDDGQGQITILPIRMLSSPNGRDSIQISESEFENIRNGAMFLFLLDSGLIVLANESEIVKIGSYDDKSVVDYIDVYKDGTIITFQTAENINQFYSKNNRYAVTINIPTRRVQLYNVFFNSQITAKWAENGDMNRLRKIADVTYNRFCKIKNTQFSVDYGDADDLCRCLSSVQIVPTYFQNLSRDARYEKYYLERAPNFLEAKKTT